MPRPYFVPLIGRAVLIALVVLCFISNTSASSAPEVQLDQTPSSLWTRAGSGKCKPACTGQQVCNSAGKCSVPTKASVYPTGACSANSQCKSGRCSDAVAVHDAVGDATLDGNTLGGKPSKCDYFSLGQSGCRSDTDCGAGVCKSGTCVALKVGDWCIFNSQCGKVNVCASNGHCIAPAPYSISPYRPCAQDKQCRTGLCTVADQFRRPTANGSSIQEPDYLCDFAPRGGSCRKDSDCDFRTGACLNSTPSPTGKACYGYPLGAACTRNVVCSTNFCDSSTHTCAPASAGYNCNTDSECFSNVCETPYYYVGNDFAPMWCVAVPTGGKCRVDVDCNAYGLVSCDKGKCGAQPPGSDK